MSQFYTNLPIVGAMATLELLKTALKQSGRSLTTPRMEVFALLNNHHPLSIAELVARCPSIDRSSIYRTVDLFEHLGIVRKLHIGWKYKLELSDQFVHHHHHLTCRSCGKIIPLNEDPQLEGYLHNLAAQHSFMSQGHELEIYGQCETCHTKATKLGAS